MKVTTETRTIVTSIALTQKEIRTLLSAKEICNKIYDELKKIDTLNSTAEKIYDNLDGIDVSLENIVYLVNVED